MKYLKKKTTNSKVSKAVKIEVKKVVKSELKKVEEYKQHTSGIGFTAIYGGAGGISLNHLTEVTQGITDTTRIGDELQLKHLQVRGVVQNNAGANSNPWNDIRIIVFQYNSQDNAPAVAELLLANVPAGNAVGAYSARNQDYLNIYNVLYDKTYHVEAGLANAANYGSTGKFAHHFDFKVPLRYAKKKIQFEAGTSFAVNGIYMLVIGSTGNVTINPTYAAQWAVSYTDS